MQSLSCNYSQVGRQCIEGLQKVADLLDNDDIITAIPVCHSMLHKVVQISLILGV